ncbi:hypothetical protein FDZ71_18040, partial [bacterium]
GLESRSDIFSPGYFRVDLGGGDVVSGYAKALFRGEPEFADEVFEAKEDFSREIPLGEALSDSAEAFFADREGKTALLAGFPWFLDWGRDSLISARGLVATGMMKEAREVITAFASMERGGALPNMLRGADSSNRDTSDAPLWLAVAAFDLAEKEGGGFLKTDCGGRELLKVIESIAENYLKGTSNGISVDPESGLVFSPSHFTWMDTNFPAATPREGYPVEIQALWMRTLASLGSWTGDSRWGELSERASESFGRLFYLPDGGFLSDCLHARRGQGAFEALPDDHLRPNQLLAVTMGAVREARIAAGVVAACSELLVPGAMRSLADRPVEYGLSVIRD